MAQFYQQSKNTISHKNFITNPSSFFHHAFNVSNTNDKHQQQLSSQKINIAKKRQFKNSKLCQSTFAFNLKKQIICEIDSPSLKKCQNQSVLLNISNNSNDQKKQKPLFKKLSKFSNTISHQNISFNKKISNRRLTQDNRVPRFIKKKQMQFLEFQKMQRKQRNGGRKGSMIKSAIWDQSKKQKQFFDSNIQQSNMNIILSNKSIKDIQAVENQKLNHSKNSLQIIQDTEIQFQFIPKCSIEQKSQDIINNQQQSKFHSLNIYKKSEPIVSAANFINCQSLPLFENKDISLTLQSNQINKIRKEQQNIEKIQNLSFSKSMSKLQAKLQYCHNKLPQSFSSKFPKLNDFQLGQMLGKGANGSVSIARHKQTGYFLALKSYPVKFVKQNLERFIQNIKLQVICKHPNIASLYGFFIQKDQFYLLMELCVDLDLSQQAKIVRKNPKDVKQVIRGVTRGLQYLHNLQIIHRDIKLQNILMCYDMPKITDFDLSVYQKNPIQVRRTFCGSPAYFSPQMLLNNSYNNKVDIWSLGVLCYQLICGYYPFQVKTFDETMNNIKNLKQKDFPENLSNEIKNFIEIMLVKDPDQRAGWRQILSHPYLWNQKE